MATSKFLRTFRTTQGVPITTAAIWLVPQANTYPTGALALTAHGTRDGQYYRDNVPDGEYKIYIDPAGGSSPTLYEEEIWIGDARITTISDHFDSADSYKLKTTGIKDLAITEALINTSAVTVNKLGNDAVETAKIKDLNVTNAKIANATILPAKLGQQTVTVVSTTNPTPSYIGQEGRDANGKRYIAIALTGTMWEEQSKVDNSTLQTSTAGVLSIKDLGVVEAKIGASSVAFSKIKKVLLADQVLTDTSLTTITHDISAYSFSTAPFVLITNKSEWGVYLVSVSTTSLVLGVNSFGVGTIKYDLLIIYQ